MTVCLGPFRTVILLVIFNLYSATDLIDALPGNSSVNTVQHATIEEAVFSVDPTSLK
jgi:hypothetical protein